MIILYEVPISMAYAGQRKPIILLGTITIMTVDFNIKSVSYRILGLCVEEFKVIFLIDPSRRYF